MASSLETPRQIRRRNALRAVLWGGLISGALDISAAFVVYGAMGARPVPLLQGIASGLLGRRAYSGGAATALLGLQLHFVIAYGAATVYVLLGRRMTFLTRRPLIAGPVYGVVVFFFMQLVVLPLSAYGFRMRSLRLALIGIAIHMVCIGLPVALVTRRFASRSLKSDS